MAPTSQACLQPPLLRHQPLPKIFHVIQGHLCSGFLPWIRKRLPKSPDGLGLAGVASNTLFKLLQLLFQRL